MLIHFHICFLKIIHLAKTHVSSLSERPNWRATSGATREKTKSHNCHLNIFDTVIFTRIVKRIPGPAEQDHCSRNQCKFSVFKIQRNQSWNQFSTRKNPRHMARGRVSSSHQPLWSELCRKWLTLPLKWFATKYEAVHAWPRKYCRLLQFRPRTFVTTKAIHVAYVTTITTRGLRYYHRHHHPWPMSTM